MINGLPARASARRQRHEVVATLASLPARTLVTRKTFAQLYTPLLSYKQAWYYANELAKDGVLTKLGPDVYMVNGSAPTTPAEPPAEPPAEDKLLGAIAQTNARIRELESELTNARATLASLKVEYMRCVEQRLEDALK